MSKTLQEIQFFNRRKIFRAINGTEVCFSHIQALELLTKPLTLDRVLIALKNIKCSWLYFDIENSNICERDANIYDYDDFRVLANWDLTKPTLEEQSEETQRAIYELLGGENE